LIEDRGVHICWESTGAERDFDCDERSIRAIGALL
jgi:hypothetical protein